MTSALADPPDTATITIRRAAGTFVVRPAPRREPPFDDEIADGAFAPGRNDRPLPFARSRRRRVNLPAPAPSQLRAVLPDPAMWGQRLLVGIIEAAGGRRPVNQLTSLLSPAVAHGLRSELEHAERLKKPHWTHRAVVRSVRSSEPAEQVAELCATVRVGERVRAIAMRLEVRHSRWCCTKLVLG
ncbi:MAG TPA: Rv3235 family protein [Jatrophihabitans sp.]